MRSVEPASGKIEAQPGIFTVDGRVGLAVHNDTGRLVSTGDPAKPGEVVAIYATGLGPLKGAVASGVPAPASPPIETLSRPTVTVAGIAAEVLFSGLPPGFVGVNQVNIRVPLDALSGELAVVMRVGAAASEPATLWVGTPSQSAIQR
jgi:uncharacterized protein (TIGR03437 family)